MDGDTLGNVTEMKTLLVATDLMVKLFFDYKFDMPRCHAAVGIQCDGKVRGHVISGQLVLYIIFLKIQKKR